MRSSPRVLERLNKHGDHWNAYSLRPRTVRRWNSFGELGGGVTFNFNLSDLLLPTSALIPTIYWLFNSIAICWKIPVSCAAFLARKAAPPETSVSSGTMSV